MKTLPRLRIASFARGAIPVALLCAITSWPAAAITIDTSPVPKPGTPTTQLAKADKQQLKAERRAEKQARKAYQRCMKLARKNGVAANCKPGSSEAPPVATVAETPPSPAVPPPAPVVAPPVTQSAPPAQQPPVPTSPAQANVVIPPAAPPPAQGNAVPPPVVPPPPVVSSALLGGAPMPPSLFLPKPDGSESSGAMLMTAVAPVSSVPEPGSLALLSVGLLGLGFAARRRKQRVA